MSKLETRIEALERREGGEEAVSITFLKAEPGEPWWMGEPVGVFESLEAFIEWRGNRCEEVAGESQSGE